MKNCHKRYCQRNIDSSSDNGGPQRKPTPLDDEEFKPAWEDHSTMILWLLLQMLKSLIC
jgi:hypothetical protein